LPVRIVTDTACDLPEELVQRHGIRLVPLGLSYNGRVYLDRFEINTADLAARLDGNTRFTVSLPSMGAFMREYRDAQAAGHSVISIHVSERLSGTCQAAQVAKGLVSGADVTVVDSGAGTMGEGWLALEAARAAQRGASKGEVLALIQELIPRVHLVFALHDLMYLHRLGRLGKAQAWLGTMLETEPILSCRGGIIEPVARVRGSGRVVKRILELCAARVPAGGRIKAAVLHTFSEDRALQLREQLERMYRVEEIWVQPMGPVVTVGAGPGTVGVAFLGCE
jgi:DegV family protein with EDD domain